MLLEKKVLIISKHKALMTQVINCLCSFMFPFEWKHTMIPILPMNMIDMLDAPFPYLVGVEPNPDLECLDIEDVVKVELDCAKIYLPDEMMMQSSMPKMPGKEYRTLKQRLIKATEHFDCIPDKVLLCQVDLAFNMSFKDPEEDYLFNHLEVRDAFLEFTSSIMSGYT